MKKLSAYIYHPTMLQREKPSDRSSRVLNTYIRVCLFFSYLWACLRYWVIPWNYFGLNSRYFNKKKGIFSKLEMDSVIPERVRLRQTCYDPDKPPRHYPVFIKPEWGQNSNGIVRVNNQKEFQAFENGIDGTMPFIVQDAAAGKKEFEIYYLRSPDDSETCAFLSITQVINTCRKHHPINSIHNPCTVYQDITQIFSSKELQKIWFSLRKIGKFRMARVGLKAADYRGILKGKFHIVEINLFLPMPLVLLTKNVGLFEKNRIMKKTMSIAARLAKAIPKKESGKTIFFQKFIVDPIRSLRIIPQGKVQ
jgi:hypothetical protein